MMRKAYDEHGDYAENYFQDVSSKAIVELESLINSWLKTKCSCKLLPCKRYRTNQNYTSTN